MTQKHFIASQVSQIRDKTNIRSEQIRCKIVSCCPLIDKEPASENEKSEGEPSDKDQPEKDQLEKERLAKKTSWYIVMDEEKRTERQQVKTSEEKGNIDGKSSGSCVNSKEVPDENNQTDQVTFQPRESHTIIGSLYFCYLIHFS